MVTMGRLLIDKMWISITALGLCVDTIRADPIVFIYQIIVYSVAIIADPKHFEFYKAEWSHLSCMM